MAYINQPPDLRTIQSDMDSRVRKLETAVRFTAPSVTTDPVNARTGDIWYNTTTGNLKTLLSAVQTISTSAFATTFTALQTFSQGISVANGATISSGNLTASTGNISATAGSVSAGTTVTAGTGMTSTTGDITATAGSFIATAGGLTASIGTVSAANLTSTGTTTVGTFNFSTTGTAVTIGAAGGASALPATPLGYVIIKIGGTDRKIPFYNV
jgi:hypothetical protein